MILGSRAEFIDITYDPSMETLGKTLVGLGLLLVVAGLLIWWLGPRLSPGETWLPGDLTWKRGGVTVYFPVVTCLVVSVVLTLLLRWFNR